jgi:hypothetical protein
MKRTIAALIAMALLATPLLALDDKAVVWEKIYRDANTDGQRIAVLLKIMEFQDREFAPILTQGLEQLVTGGIETGTVSARNDKNLLARLLVRELGELKSPEAAELVFRVYADATESVLRGEAAVALGKIRATQYAPRLALDLSGINTGPKPSIARDQEIIALGLVQGLNSMRAPEGYEAVFLASLGWYPSSSRVKETAREATLTMVDDPGESLAKILEGNPSIEIKTIALETELASKAPAESKIAFARKALRVGIDRVTHDPATRAAVIKMRTTATVGLTSLRDNSEETVPLYLEVIKMDRKNDETLDETLKTYVALGVNGSDSAAEYLASRLSEYNELERSKANTPRDKSLIRQIVASMALTKNPKVRGSLDAAQFIDYDANIIRLVKDALTKVPAAN